MTNAPPKKRPWFQLHLSTCVVLMVVAGFLVYRNATPCTGCDPWGTTRYGWPGVAFEEYIEIEISGPPSSIPQDVVSLRSHWLLSGLVLDAAIAMLLLGVTARYSEMWIRRRERARTAQEPAP